MQHFCFLHVLYIESIESKKMRGRLLAILTGALVLLSACNDDETYELFQEYATPQALSSDVSISIMEHTQTVDTIQIEDPGLYLYIETTELYPYCNYGILRSTFQSNDTLVVRLEDVIKPGVYLSPPGHASTSVRIPENTKHIVFLRGNESNSFSLTVDEESLILEPVNTSFSVSDYIIYSRDRQTTP